MDGNVHSDYTEDELDELEDELLEEDFEEREEQMTTDGRSVFEIDRLRKGKAQDPEDNDQRP